MNKNQRNLNLLYVILLIFVGLGVVFAPVLSNVVPRAAVLNENIMAFIIFPVIMYVLSAIPMVSTDIDTSVEEVVGKGLEALTFSFLLMFFLTRVSLLPFCLAPLYLTVLSVSLGIFVYLIYKEKGNCFSSIYLTKVVLSVALMTLTSNIGAAILLFNVLMASGSLIELLVKSLISFNDAENQQNNAPEIAPLYENTPLSSDDLDQVSLSLECCEEYEPEQELVWDNYGSDLFSY